MKKVILLLSLIVLCCGCGEKKVNEPNPEATEQKVDYNATACIKQYWAISTIEKYGYGNFIMLYAHEDKLYLKSEGYIYRFLTEEEAIDKENELIEFYKNLDTKIERNDNQVYEILLNKIDASGSLIEEIEKLKSDGYDCTTQYYK